MAIGFVRHIRFISNLVSIQVNNSNKEEINEVVNTVYDSPAKRNPLLAKIFLRKLCFVIVCFDRTNCVTYSILASDDVKKIVTYACKVLFV